MGQKDEPRDNFHLDFLKIAHRVLDNGIKLFLLFFYRHPLKLKIKKLVKVLLRKTCLLCFTNIQKILIGLIQDIDIVDRNSRNAVVSKFIRCYYTII